MNSFFRTLRDQLPLLGFGVTAAGLSVLIPALLGEPLDGALYAAELILLITLCISAFRIRRSRRLVNALSALGEHLSMERLALPEPRGQAGEAYTALIEALDENRRALARKLAESQSEENGYYTLWVHQMKTPIAAMGLILDGLPGEEASLLRGELFRIEGYADLALRYVKLKDIASDFLPEQCALEPIVRGAVKKFALPFIQKGLTVSVGPMEKTLVTDSRWLSFILEQILSNAVKYTKTGGVTVTLTGNALSIRDTGVGIRPEDLPRIFERGFTGRIGRLDTRASGIGLFLAKKAADALGIRLAAESVPGKGTALTLLLPEKIPLALT